MSSHGLAENYENVYITESGLLNQQNPTRIPGIFFTELEKNPKIHTETQKTPPNSQSNGD